MRAFVIIGRVKVRSFRPHEGREVFCCRASALDTHGEGVHAAPGDASVGRHEEATVTRPILARVLCAAALVCGNLLGTVDASEAAGHDLELPAGTACPGFAVGIDISNSNHRVERTFTDSAGKTVRVLSAGKGDDLTFTNLQSGSVVQLKGNGSVSRRVLNADGVTSTVTLTGHNVLILFPTDVPAGPSTTLIVGSLVYTDDGFSNFVVLRTTGNTTDLCAALSSP